MRGAWQPSLLRDAGATLVALMTDLGLISSQYEKKRYYSFCWLFSVLVKR